MIYRNAPLQPTRLLLRVVFSAGASTLVAAVPACGSSGSPDVAAEPCVDGTLVCGSLTTPQDSGDRCQNEAGQFICGITDAAADGGSDTGQLMGSLDAAPGCDGCGIMVTPEAGADE